jgi:hypothetical protein
MELQYLLQENYGDYNAPLIDVNYSRFMAVLKQRSKMIKENSVKSTWQFYKEKDIALNGVISTRINYSLTSDQSPLYLLGMDCDNIDDKNQATLELTSMGINHTSIVSSIYPIHFWIIADFIGSIEECVFLMEKIPGVDVKYILGCEKKKNIVFRAFPKETSGLPIFPLSNTLCSINFGNWYMEFRNYWNSDYIKEIYNNVSSNKLLESEKKLDIISSDKNIKWIFLI